MAEWTVETLYIHITKQLNDKEARDSERFLAQKEMTALALSAADRAVSKAEVAAEKRFEGVNEFRAALGDQQRQLMPRIEAELQINNIRKEMEETKAAFRKEIEDLKSFNLKRVSKGEGLHMGWLILVGAVGFVALLMGVISKFQ